MTGLEKITSRILEDAQVTAQVKLEVAEAQSAEIISDAGLLAERTAREMRQRVGEECAALIENANATAVFERRKFLLTKKQEMLARLIAAAGEKLRTLPDGEYFELLERMGEKRLHPGKGTLFLSAGDLGRLPGDFVRKLEALAGARGGEVTLAEKPAEIDGGFILAYEGIEENCSFEALIYAARESLLDKIGAELFS